LRLSLVVKQLNWKHPKLPFWRLSQANRLNHPNSSHHSEEWEWEWEDVCHRTDVHLNCHKLALEASHLLQV